METQILTCTQDFPTMLDASNYVENIKDEEYYTIRVNSLLEEVIEGSKSVKMCDEVLIRKISDNKYNITFTFENKKYKTSKITSFLDNHGEEELEAKVNFDNYEICYEKYNVILSKDKLIVAILDDFEGWI